MYISTTDI